MRVSTRVSSREESSFVTCVPEVNVCTVIECSEGLMSPRAVCACVSSMKLA